MTWEIKSFEELTNLEWHEIIKERMAVFVVEQDCAYMEIDGHDPASYHLFLKEGDEVVAYARLMPSGTIYQEASIGRIIVKADQRGKGYAKEIMERGMKFLLNELGESEIKLQAEYYIKDLYASYEFEITSDIFLDEGIEHVYMLYRVPDKKKAEMK
ncbi:GNAT family N-acetyltransferase [Bacillus shivajii]|uniref:GNAT family N-acetyltransferase n=1 Tax=Bacillus shivajii TaxID=1983719 RepID=UPI001CFAB82A|nr:GNAT family N-acetyltransferase [Bacillus shivajii]UCZ53876.1 GNAT family N-acetyltransferase [Bacillus shivajii]